MRVFLTQGLYTGAVVCGVCGGAVVTGLLVARVARVAKLLLSTLLCARVC